MPTKLTPQGWVRVPAPAPRKRSTNVDPVQALRGSLAYFSCQPLPPSSKVPVNKPEFPYDLSASPEKLKQQAQSQMMMEERNRTISAPQPRLDILDEGDEVEAEVKAEVEVADQKSRSSRSNNSIRSASPPPPPKSHRSLKSHRREYHQDDSHSVSSSSSSSKSSSSSTSSHSSRSSSRSSSSSIRSYRRHRTVAPIPQPVIIYQTPAPPPQPWGPAGCHSYGCHHSDMYASRPQPPPPPPPPTSRRSMSTSWYNATTPLHL